MSNEEIYERMALGERTPVGAQLRVGKKDPRTGNPIDNDRFHIVSPVAGQGTFQKRGGQYNAPIKELHPHFAKYNGLPPESRHVFQGVLCGATVEECHHIEYRASKLPGHPQHPNYLPTCSSRDAITARRLYAVGGAAKLPEGVIRDEEAAPDELWGRLKCPAERCPHRNGDVPRCKIASWLYFLPRWREGIELPTPLMRWHTSSGANAEAIRGFFSQTRSWAQSIGIDSFSLVGLPFTLTLSMASSRKKGTRFPLVTIAHDGDLAGFFAAQSERIRLAGGRIVDPSRLVSARSDGDERGVDALEIEPPRLPSAPGGPTQGYLVF